ncbi:MAG: hypothetical protein ACOC1P_00330 [Minisyncoccales bacterium]
MSRSESLKKHHAQAKTKYELYKQFVGSKGVSYQDFRADKTPLENQVVAYDVSFQASYRGNVGGIFIALKTFTVFGLRGDEENIQQKTMEMVVTSRGKSTSAMFNPGLADAVEGNLDVKVKPRGMEQSEKKPRIDEYETIFTGGFAVRELDTEMKFKNHKNREGVMKLDIRKFL